MVTGCDTETGHEVVDEGPDGGLPLERSPVCLNDTIEWNTDNESDIEPVDVFVPVEPGHRLVGDVRLL